MASSLIVEDGSGVAGADAFATQAYVTQYHLDRGNTSWAALANTDDKKDIAIRQGTFYLCLKYGGLWRGVKADQTFALDWPRMYAVDDDGYAIAADEIPEKLKWATAEAALRSLTNELVPDSSTTTSNLTERTVKLGPITDSKKWDINAGGATNLVIFREVALCVRSLIIPPAVVRG